MSPWATPIRLNQQLKAPLLSSQGWEQQLSPPSLRGTASNLKPPRRWRPVAKRQSRTRKGE
eukprot:13304163-Alexandrium_andersonii.AAC.1